MTDQQVIDLRSDTVTRPTAGMRRAMAEARVGDDVYGEDPSVNELEARVAELAGKEAALFVPSGSMANLIAQLVHVRPGEEVILGEGSHSVVYEVGAGAALAGVQYSVVPGSGLITAAEVVARLRPDELHEPRTALVWIENTHNKAGGRVYDLATIRSIRDVCDRHDLPLHMDGARVFNAAVAARRPLAEIVGPADSFSFCLSKGLGAPVGSVICGSAEFRKKALRFRKMLGGGMRQAGALAAAGLYAIAHHVERLAEDHDNARHLAAALAGHRLIRIDEDAVETNIVAAGLSPEMPDDAAERLVESCEARGVLFQTLGVRKLRFVTHLDVTFEQVDAAVPVFLEQLDAMA